MTADQSAGLQDVAGFCGRFSASFCMVECEGVAGQHTFATRFDGVRLGSVEVFRYRGHSLRSAARSVQHIRANPVDDFVMLLPESNAFEVAQLGHQTVIEPGHFVFLKTAEPFGGFCDRRNDGYSEIKMRIPGQLLRRKVPNIDQCCGRPLAADAGVGLLMRSMIDSAFATGATLSPYQTRMFGLMLANTIAMTAMDSRELKQLASNTRELSLTRVRLLAEEFMAGHYADPELDCDMIARHCHVSVRQLHAAFDAAATTAGTTLRELRLQQARTDLRDPRWQHRTIAQIAADSGYASAAGFARAYRERFGYSPREERPSQPG